MFKYSILSTKPMTTSNIYNIGFSICCSYSIYSYFLVAEYQKATRIISSSWDLLIPPTEGIPASYIYFCKYMYFCDRSFMLYFLLSHSIKFHQICGRLFKKSLSHAMQCNFFINLVAIAQLNMITIDCLKKLVGVF